MRTKFIIFHLLSPEKSCKRKVKIFKKQITFENFFNFSKMF